MCGKQRFTNIGHVKAFMKKMKRRKRLRKRSMPYWCEPCQCYHFGRLPKRAYTVLRFIQAFCLAEGRFPSHWHIKVGTGLGYYSINKAINTLIEYRWLKQEGERLALSITNLQ